MPRHTTKNLPVPIALSERIEKKINLVMPALIGSDRANRAVREILSAKSQWAQTYALELAETVGRGYIGAGPLQMVRAAAYASGWSEIMYREAAAMTMEGEAGVAATRTTRLMELGAKMADAARLQLTAAQAIVSQQAALMAVQTEDVLTPFLEQMKEEEEAIAKNVDTDYFKSPI